MKKICIITARGGSKRIPRKNIRDFLGKPIISYSIEAALKSELFDEVMVSTDDNEIALISKKYGANVPFLRSHKNSNDYATTSDVILEVLSAYSNKFEYFCCLYPTAPFVTKKKLIDSFDVFSKSKMDSLISIAEFSYPPQRGFIINEDKLQMREPQYLNSRSQDLTKIYHDVGQFYWGRVDRFLENKKLIGNNTSYFNVDPLEVQDIDNEDDWKIAEIKYKIKNETKGVFNG